MEPAYSKPSASISMSNSSKTAIQMEVLEIIYRYRAKKKAREQRRCYLCVSGFSRTAADPNQFLTLSDYEAVIHSGHTRLGTFGRIFANQLLWDFTG